MQQGEYVFDGRGVSCTPCTSDCAVRCYLGFRALELVPVQSPRKEVFVHCQHSAHFSSVNPDQIVPHNFVRVGGVPY